MIPKSLCARFSATRKRPSPSARGKTRRDLDQDRLLNLALTRLLEIISEAANRVPEEIQVRYPDLPWSQMIGARNRLIHGYDSVDFDILWRITVAFY